MEEFLRRANQGIKLVESNYVHYKAILLGGGAIQIGNGHVIGSEDGELKKGYIQLAYPDERITIQELKNGRILSEEEMFRFFAGQGYPKYANRTINGGLVRSTKYPGIGQDIWNSLGDYRKIALLSYVWNCGAPRFSGNRGISGSVAYNQFIDALKNKNYDEAARIMNPLVDGGHGLTSGNAAYSTKRRRAEAQSMKTNTPMTFDGKASSSKTAPKGAGSKSTSGKSTSGGTDGSAGSSGEVAGQSSSPCGVSENKTSYFIDIDLEKYKNTPIWVFVEINGSFEKQTFLRYYKNGDS